MMKKLLLIALTGLSAAYLNAQCEVTATSSQVSIPCGATATLSHAGQPVHNNDFYEDFNSQSATGWQFTQQARFDNPCGAGPGGAHLWMGNTSGAPRKLETYPLNFGPAYAPYGGTICFDLKFARQAGTSPCEGPDLDDEGVYLQYSINGGTSWVNINYFHPQGGYNTQMTTWNNYCFPMPASALINGVKFRWYQSAVTNANTDHWGIDNVEIKVNDPDIYFTYAHDGYTTPTSGTNPTPVSPSQTTTYTVTMHTSFGNCTSDVTVVVGPPPSMTAPNNISVCSGTTIAASAFTSSPAGAGYTWTNSDASIGLPASGTGNLPSFTATNNTSQPLVSTITVTPVLNGTCNGQSQTYTISIEPKPTMDTPGNIAQCHGLTVDEIVYSSTMSNITYAWTNSNPGIGLAASGNGNTPSFTATNASQTPLSAVITVTPSQNTCTGTPVSFNITANALPVVDAGPNQSVCPNTNITLSGAGAQTYEWNNNVTNGTPFSAGENTLTYEVTGTDANGCKNSDNMTVTVFPAPVINGGADRAICIGDSTILNATGAVSPAWDHGVTNGIWFSPAQTETYSLTAADANGCPGNDQVTVTVNPLPVPDAGTDYAICIGDSTILTGDGAVTYAWNNGVTDGEWFSPTTTATYSVIATDANGCKASDQIIVTINPLPVIEAGPDQILCPGISVTVSGSGAVSYAWNNSVVDSQPFLPAVGTSTYTVTGTDINGCRNTDNLAITTYPVTIIDGGTDHAICIGDSTIFNASGAVSYTWNNGITDGVWFSPTTTSTYSLLAIDANGCESTDQVTVTVNPLPVINAGADQTICAGTLLNLSGTGGTVYTWSNSVLNNQPFHPPVGTTTYSVTGTDANGCKNTDNVTITVLPHPVAEITSTSLTGNPGHVVDFGNASTHSNHYTWNFGEGTTANENSLNNHTITYAAIDSYPVILIASNGICADTAEVLVVISQFPDPEIYIPNVFTPNGDNTNELWWIKVTLGNSIEVLIFNRWGDHMHTMTSFDDRWDGTVKGDKANDGVYFYKYHITGLNGNTFDGHGHLTLER